MNTTTSQREKLLSLLRHQHLARSSELVAQGIARTTISRAVSHGEVVRVGRGLYQLAETDVDIAQTLAEASKQVPKGVICLLSALAYYGLTDQMPRRVWIAIGSSAWYPKVDYPPLRVVRFRSPNFEREVTHPTIGGVSVPMYSIAKSLSDAFRNPKLVDRSVAIECLRNAVEQRKATPGEITEVAMASGAWKRMRPYLETLTSYG